jgi:hypothetical protein
MAETCDRTVLLSIHQPRARIVKRFDSIHLLAAGSAPYSRTRASTCPRMSTSSGSPLTPWTHSASATATPAPPICRRHLPSPSHRRRARTTEGPWRMPLPCLSEHTTKHEGLSVTAFSSWPRASSGGPVFVSMTRCAMTALPPVEQRAETVEQTSREMEERRTGGAERADR